MTEQDAARILLVRSIDETEPTLFPPERLSDALARAADDLRPASWFLTRARYLLDSVPHIYGAITRMARLPQGLNIPACALAFVVGLGTNYLGAVEKIPLVLNPIMALVAWNLLLYLTFIASWLASRINKGTRSRESAPRRYGNKRSSRSAQSAGGELVPSRFAPWTARVLFPSIWISVHNFTLRFHATRKQSASFVKVARRFWHHWLDAAQPLVAARWRRLLHCSALFLTAGAVVGMYIRGVFLRYQVIWTSTFITDEATVAMWVEYTFGPAMLLSRLTGRDLQAEIDIAQLMSSEGAPAAPWIHLFVLTALLVVIAPRFVLAAVQAFYVHRAKQNIRIDFDGYFGRLIRPQIEVLITQEVENGVQKVAHKLATFVCERFYETHIVPELARFRANGGRITDLRQRINERCVEFKGEIGAQAETALTELEQAIAPAVERILAAVQRDFRFTEAIRPDLAANLEIFPKNELDRSVKPIGSGLTDAVGATVSASIAVVLGTLAGGFGQSLETAVLVALFGTSGPIGFVIGAIAGLIVGAGAWWFGREKMTAGIENITLPSRLVGMVLWRSRFERLLRDGRERCYRLVNGRVSELLSPLGERISAEVWTQLEELWSRSDKQLQRERIETS